MSFLFFFAAHFPHFDDHQYYLQKTLLVAKKTFANLQDDAERVVDDHHYQLQRKHLQMTNRDDGSVGSEWGNGWAVSQFREVRINT